PTLPICASRPHAARRVLRLSLTGHSYYQRMDTSPAARHDMTPALDLSGRVAVVTGASRGIGYFLARELAAAGAHVIAVARTVGGLEELDDEIRAGGGETTLVPLDLADMAGIDRLGAAIHERWGKLDILIANAAIVGVVSPIGHVEAKVFERVMNVNVVATWRLIQIGRA